MQLTYYARLRADWLNRLKSFFEAERIKFKIREVVLRSGGTPPTYPLITFKPPRRVLPLPPRERRKRDKDAEEFLRTMRKQLKDRHFNSNVFKLLGIKRPGRVILAFHDKGGGRYSISITAHDEVGKEWAKYIICMLALPKHKVAVKRGSLNYSLQERERQLDATEKLASMLLRKTAYWGALEEFKRNE